MFLAAVCFSAKYYKLMISLYSHCNGKCWKKRTTSRDFKNDV